MLTLNYGKLQRHRCCRLRVVIAPFPVLSSTLTLTLPFLLSLHQALDVVLVSNRLQFVRWISWGVECPSRRRLDPFLRNTIIVMMVFMLVCWVPVLLPCCPIKYLEMTSCSLLKYSPCIPLSSLWRGSNVTPPWDNIFVFHSGVEHVSLSDYFGKYLVKANIPDARTRLKSQMPAPTPNHPNRCVEFRDAST